MRHEQRSIANLLNDKTAKAQGAPLALTGASNTITAAGMIGGLVTVNGGTAGAVTSTLATGALLGTALDEIWGVGGFPADYSFDFHVINLSTVAAEDVTVTTATGWTLVGNMVITESAAASGANSVGHFRVRRTGTSTFVLYRIG